MLYINYFVVIKSFLKLHRKIFIALSTKIKLKLFHNWITIFIFNYISVFILFGCLVWNDIIFKIFPKSKHIIIECIPCFKSVSTIHNPLLRRFTFANFFTDFHWINIFTLYSCYNCLITNLIIPLSRFSLQPKISSNFTSIQLTKKSLKKFLISYHFFVFVWSDT